MNVKMGANASLSWSQVTNQPTAATLGGLMANSTRLTHIDANGVYTGTITADQIIAGKIDASFINTTNLSAEQIYQQGFPSNFVRVGGQLGDLQLHYKGQNYFTIYNGIDYASLIHLGSEHLRFSGATNIAVPLGTWDFSEANMIGLTATFG
ncbi:hypothetical protein DFQ01_109141 [Paenibacillus cellulosilyticus]|uniref:Uncharacterized protein n=1 Tax=Paenibacillus cellulosilyticus TaxID=375489 RepID=A0A2V2YUB2_9BACL|nr:hypothetical protein [Paenibacillus cellulosilyticus]PWW02516.1 hypothetical protein DFQ01_109141 [Paenibacillus cellulosilyticus]QKS47214.1 hypothetical protein HUB94_22505 [Paenibacillus cellulosilyticus]